MLRPRARKEIKRMRTVDGRAGLLIRTKESSPSRIGPQDGEETLGPRKDGTSGFTRPGKRVILERAIDDNLGFARRRRRRRRRRIRAG